MWIKAGLFERIFTAINEKADMELSDDKCKQHCCAYYPYHGFKYIKLVIFQKVC